MNDNISKKNKEDWENFISSNEKLIDKDKNYQQKKIETKRSIDLHGFSLEDANIESITENDTDPDKAYESYVCFGDDPWIEGVDFSAFEYAKIKIQEVLKG